MDRQNIVKMTFATRWAIITAMVLAKADGERRIGVETIRPSETEGLLYDPDQPVVKTEFSVILLSRDTDCYYHYVPKYASMQFQFRVTTPPGTMARSVVSIDINSPSGDRIYNAHFKMNDEMEDTVARESGYYEICLYNSLERFGDKKVRVLFSYTNRGKLDEKMKAVNETDALTEEIQGRVINMTVKTMIMHRTLFFLKISEGGHYEFMLSMSQYVKTASIVTCVAICLVMYLQVVSLKRPFQSPANVKPKV